MITSTKDICSTEDETPIATLGGNAKEKDAPATLSSWEDIKALLKAVPCFTAPQPPISNMEEFFSFSHHHFVDLHGDPHMAGMVRPSHVTPESTLWCTHLLLKYTIKESGEVVGFSHFLSKLA